MRVFSPLPLLGRDVGRPYLGSFPPLTSHPFFFFRGDSLKFFLLQVSASGFSLFRHRQSRSCAFSFWWREDLYVTGFFHFLFHLAYRNFLLFHIKRVFSIPFFSCRSERPPTRGFASRFPFSFLFFLSRSVEKSLFPFTQDDINIPTVLLFPVAGLCDFLPQSKLSFRPPFLFLRREVSQSFQTRVLFLSLGVRSGGSSRSFPPLQRRRTPSAVIQSQLTIPLL